MRRFLFLLLSLTAGCKAIYGLTACQEGWVGFNCKYPKQNGKSQSITLTTARKASIKSIQENKWETRGKVSLYHDTRNKELRVAIPKLEKQHFGNYTCGSAKAGLTIQVNQRGSVGKEECKKPFQQTAYRTAQTTLTCDFPAEKHKSTVKFLCKDDGVFCEDILSTKSSPKSNGTMTLTETDSGFKVSISNVSLRDKGVYWCGVGSHDGSYRAGLRKIQLQVEGITTFKRSPTTGQNLTYWCEYPRHGPITKFICKGEDPSMCQRLMSTEQPSSDPRFTLSNERKNGNITITMRRLTANDTGTYWCGAEQTKSNHFYRRLLMAVVPTPTLPALVHVDGGSNIVITVAVCVAVLLLLTSVVFLILIYKRFLKSKNTTTRAAPQSIGEDCIYEEIENRTHEPDTGNEVNRIYTNVYTDPSDSLHYTAVNFQTNSSDRAADEALILKPMSSACKYSTLNHKPNPVKSTVPTATSQDPLYSTVNKPQ